MIIIADDTFVDRHKYHDIGYLISAPYSKSCFVYSKIRTIDIEELEYNLPQCDFFCNHKTLQLYDIKGNALDIENNSKQRENIFNKVSLAKIPRIEFSRGLETDFESKKIDKDLFYTNLRAFLNYYIEYSRIESKILFWGPDYEERERFSDIQKMLLQIRAIRINELSNNKIILEGLKNIFPDQSPKSIIETWINNNLSKNDIIQEINNHIK